MTSTECEPRCAACGYPVRVDAKCAECGRDRESQLRVRRRRTLVRWLGIPWVGFVALFGWAYLRGNEQLCFFWPSIDTRFAAGYSDAAFNAVAPDMSAAAVEHLLGKPLEIVPAADGSESWWYTSDGAAPFGDWAWLGREIVFRAGRVAEINSRTYYD